MAIENNCNLSNQSKRIGRNIVLSIFAQAVGLAIGLIINLIIPKFIGIEEYSYWQTYILYSGLTGIFHFGLLDGMVLRYSNLDYENLDKPTVKFQFNCMLIVDILFACIFILCGSKMIYGNYKIVLFLVAFSVISRNCYTYTSYLFQITNRIPKYVTTQIIRSCVFGFGIVLLLLNKTEQFYFYCLFDLIADFVAICYGIVNNRGLYFSLNKDIKNGVKELLTNVKSGVFLLVSNWTAMLLVGSSKIMIQWRWNEIVFGKVSFGFSITNLFLTFVSAISVVLFPTLKRMDQKELPSTYMKIRDLLSPLLIVAMIFYYPGCIILKYWLPSYTESLTYAGVLLPLIVFSSKVNLLTNNYLKAFRKEKTMLVINVSMIVLAFFLYYLSAFIFDSLKLTLYLTVFVIMLTSIVSEICVAKILHVKFFKECIIEIFMSIIFIASVKCFTFWNGLLFYIIIVCFYCFFKKINTMRNSIRKKLNNHLLINR